MRPEPGLYLSVSQCGLDVGNALFMLVLSESTSVLGAGEGLGEGSCLQHYSPGSVPPAGSIVSRIYRSLRTGLGRGRTTRSASSGWTRLRVRIERLCVDEMALTDPSRNTDQGV